MKIEKVNDNQIRCTLSREDLADRQLKLSELAYGTEKAKMLFRDMMQQAAFEFGFEAEDIPLMIEAIPLSSDSITLIITKVEYPEELDTRFSKFAPAHEDSNSIDDSVESISSEGADDILDLFKKIREENNKPKDDDSKDTEFIPLQDTLAKTDSPDSLAEITEDSETADDTIVNLTKLYIFKHFDEVSKLASILQHFYDGTNSLYKNENEGRYFLVIHKDQHSPEEFNKICNILSEYAQQKKYSKATEAYFQEHLNILVADNALQVLATL